MKTTGYRPGGFWRQRNSVPRKRPISWPMILELFRRSSAGKRAVKRHMRKVEPCKWIFRGRSGSFTLVEAIVAMSIMAIGVTGILGSFTSALVGAAVAEDYAKASLLLQQVLTQVRAGAITPYDVNQGTFSGEARFAWSVSFTESDIDYLYRVDVIVAWRKAGRTHNLKSTTYQYCNPFALPVVM